MWDSVKCIIKGRQSCWLLHIPKEEKRMWWTRVCWNSSGNFLLKMQSSHDESFLSSHPPSLHTSSFLSKLFNRYLPFCQTDTSAQMTLTSHSLAAKFHLPSGCRLLWACWVTVARCLLPSSLPQRASAYRRDYPGAKRPTKGSSLVPKGVRSQLRINILIWRADVGRDKINILYWETLFYKP